MRISGQSIKAVLLDIDGTLLDSNDAHAAAFVEAMREQGFDVTHEAVRRLIGMGSDKLLPAAVGVAHDSPIGERIAKRKKEIFRASHLSRIQPCRGSRDLVLALRERGLDLIAASSAGEDELDELLKAAEVDDLLEQRTSSDDADESKPDPDIVNAALKRLKRKPGEAIMIGDTPYDVEAAGRAKVPIIALRCGGWNGEQLSGAAAIYDDPADLLAHIDI